MIWIGWCTVACLLVAAGLWGYRYGSRGESLTPSWPGWIAAGGVVVLVACCGFWLGQGQVVGGIIAWVVLIAVGVEVGFGGYFYAHHARRGTTPRVARASRVSAVLAILLVALYCGLWLGDRGAKHAPNAGDSGSSSPAAVPKGPVVPVRTAPLRLATIAETITAYGRVVAQPGETRVLSLPYESIVQRVFVSTGEQIAAGASLIEMDASPAARLQLQQAQAMSSAANEELKQVQEEYQQRLAIKTQLQQAENGAQAAQLRLSTLEKQGVGETRTEKAHASGIVTRIAVQAGQLVAAGAPLIEVAIGDRIEAQLGIEPEDVPYVHEGDTIQLTPVHLDPGKPVVGHVRLVTKQVTSATELIAVYVALPAGANLALSTYVRGILVTQSKHTLVVPAEAVLPEKQAYTLYTAKDGHAVKHVVHVGLETDSEVEVQGDDLKEGDLVILTGNYELQPGMAVSPQTSP